MSQRASNRFTPTLCWFWHRRGRAENGHTQEAGYGIVGSAVQDDRRIIFVLSGMPSAEARAEEAEAVVNWAFRQFAQRPLGKAGQRIAQADVWMGQSKTVGLTLDQDLNVLLPVLAGDDIKAEVVYTGPIKAPVTAGDTLAELVIQPEGLPETRVPLVAETTVAPAGFMAKVSAVALILLERLNRGPEEETGAAS